MMRVWRWGASAQRALTAVGACCLVVVVSAVQAVRVEPLPAVSDAAPAESLDAKVQERRQAAPESIVFAAVARDPFRVERTRPAMRYRLPGDRIPTRQPATIRRQRVPVIDLVGIAVMSDGEALAALQVRGRSPRLVRVGETIEGLELVLVDSVSATLAGSDTTIVLRMQGRSGGAEEP
jgi:hypothetical protein